MNEIRVRVSILQLSIYTSDTKASHLQGTHTVGSISINLKTIGNIVVLNETTRIPILHSSRFAGSFLPVKISLIILIRIIYVSYYGTLNDHVYNCTVRQNPRRWYSTFTNNHKHKHFLNVQVSVPFLNMITIVAIWWS